jgi:predicted outer membrane protein
MKKIIFPPFSICVGGLLTLAIFSLSACDSPSATNSLGSTDRDRNRIASQLTDGEILQVLYVHNNTEIRQAEQIANISDSHELRENAQMVIDDYGSANEQIRVIVDSGIELQPSELSRDMEFQADSNRERLADLRDAEFNCEYLDMQEEQRKLVLDTLQDDLINAQDQRVRQLVSEAAPAMERHIAGANSTRSRVQCGLGLTGR